MTNWYEQKLADRKARLEARAEKLQAKGNAAYDRAHKMAEVIPFGQPILIGHHSEGRDRNYRGRVHSTFGKAFEAMDEAKEVAGRAASVGTGGISSDDPDAIDKLREKLAAEEAEQVKMVAINKAFRKGDHAAVLALGIPQSVLNIWLDAATSKWDKGIPSYRLSNNSANIRRIKQRVEQLEKAGEREHREIVHSSGVKLVQNVEANRVQFIFPGKPADDIRALLKSHGFRWAPSEGAWQRHLNNSGVYAAQMVLRSLPVEVAT